MSFENWMLLKTVTISFLLHLLSTETVWKLSVNAGGGTASVSVRISQPDVLILNEQIIHIIRIFDSYNQKFKLHTIIQMRIWMPFQGIFGSADKETCLLDPFQKPWRNWKAALLSSFSYLQCSSLPWYSHARKVAVSWQLVVPSSNSDIMGNT